MNTLFKLVFAVVFGVFGVAMLCLGMRVSAESTLPTISFPQSESEQFSITYESSNFLYEQFENTGTGLTSQVWDNIPTYSFYGADDFVVPLGSTWVITSVTVLGNSVNGFDPRIVDVGFFSDRPTTPVNDPTTSSMNPDLHFTDDVSPYDISGGNFSVQLTTPLEISACDENISVWLSVATDQPYDPGTQIEWRWLANLADPIDIRGYETHYINPGDEYGFPTGWNPGNTFSSTGQPYDLAFGLQGTETTTICDPTSIELSSTQTTQEGQRFNFLLLTITVLLIGWTMFQTRNYSIEKSPTP